MAAAEGEVTAISFDDFDEVWEEEDAPAVPSPGRIEEIENKKTEVELTRITRVRDADFTRIGVLGVGSFGKVVLAKQKATGDLYALKFVSLARLQDRKQFDRALDERAILATLEHPHVVKLHFAFRVKGHAVLGFEYCAGGELFHHLCKKRVLDAKATAFYGAEIALALQCAHEAGVVYRDVKPENCFLDHRGHLKLGDFGLARAGVTSPFRGAHSVCGTPEYMAPDVLARKPSGYGTAVDWWGLGVCCYELLTGLPAWYTSDRRKLFDRIRSAPLRLPPSVPPEAGACVAALLRRHPKQRLCALNGADELRGEAFFASVDFDALVLGALDPPIQPCSRLSRPAHRANFDGRFTTLPVDTPVEGPDPAFLDGDDALATGWEFVRPEPV
mgnify:CR=1 FL=1